MRVAAAQILTGPDVGENLEIAKQAVRDAAAQGARLIVLPEATSQAPGTGRLDKQAQDLDGPFATGLRELAEELGVVVVVGMFRPADSVDGINRIYNSALVTGAGLHVAYDKIHTYDAFDFRESRTVKPGTDTLVVEVDGINIGVAVCYDIRFPEMFVEMARAGAQIIAVPTSWEDGDGKLEQLRVLTAARALDSTSVIVAAGQAKPEHSKGGPTGAGHSSINAADGRLLAQAGYDPEILVVDVDVEEIAKVRETLPVLRAY